MFVWLFACSNCLLSVLALGCLHFIVVCCIDCLGF